MFQYGENEALSGYHYAGMLAGAAMGRALKARVKRLAQVRHPSPISWMPSPFQRGRALLVGGRAPLKLAVTLFNSLARLTHSPLSSRFVARSIVCTVCVVCCQEHSDLSHTLPLSLSSSVWLRASADRMDALQVRPTRPLSRPLSSPYLGPI